MYLISCHLKSVTKLVQINLLKIFLYLKRHWSITLQKIYNIVNLTFMLWTNTDIQKSVQTYRTTQYNLFEYKRKGKVKICVYVWIIVSAAGIGKTWLLFRTWFVTILNMISCEVEYYITNLNVAVQRILQIRLNPRRACHYGVFS